MLPKPTDPGAPVDLDAVIARLQPIVLDALGRLGLGAVTFQGSADLRWINDRKVGGISAGDFGRVLSVGGFLNIKPPNLDLYLQVVRVPGRQVRGQDRQGHARVRLHRRGGRRPPGHLRGVPRRARLPRSRLRASSSTATPMTDVERGALAKISQRIASDDQVRRVSSERFAAEHRAGRRVGFAQPQGPQAVPRRVSRSTRRAASTR